MDPSAAVPGFDFMRESCEVLSIPHSLVDYFLDSDRSSRRCLPKQSPESISSQMFKGVPVENLVLVFTSKEFDSHGSLGPFPKSSQL